MNNRLARGALAAGLFIPMGSSKSPAAEITPHTPPTVEYSGIREQIAEQLGNYALQLVILPPEAAEEIYQDSLVVQPLLPATDCAVEYYFDEASPEATVSVGIFAKLADMTDVAKINGDAMFDGTYGHGDTDASGIDSLPPMITLSSDGPLVTQALDYMQQKTIEVCDIFETHVNDPNGGHPG